MLARFCNPAMESVPLDVPRPPAEVIDLEVNFDGAVVWNGNVVPNLQMLESYFRSEAAKASQPEIHLRADRRARYGEVAVVLAAAQRNRLRKIGLWIRRRSRSRRSAQFNLGYPCSFRSGVCTWDSAGRPVGSCGSGAEE